MKRNKTTALIFSVLLGGLGVDRFYLGYTGLGILKLLTAGCLGILYIIDIVNIATGKLLPADGSAYEEETADKPAPAPQQSTSNVYDDFGKLKELYEQGVLTDEEFARMKTELLKKV